MSSRVEVAELDWLQAEAFFESRHGEDSSGVVLEARLSAKK